MAETTSSGRKKIAFLSATILAGMLLVAPYQVRSVMSNDAWAEWRHQQVMEGVESAMYALRQEQPSIAEDDPELVYRVSLQPNEWTSGGMYNEATLDTNRLILQIVVVIAFTGLSMAMIRK